MKLYTNKRYNTIALYAILVIAVNVLIVVAILKFGAIMNLLSTIVTVLMPIIWGLVIAFLMNPIMVNFEKLYKKIVRNVSGKRLMRTLSITVASIVFMGIVAGVIAIIVPEFIRSFNDIVDNFSNFVESSQKWLDRVFRNYPKVQKFISDKIVEFGTDLTKIQPMLENILSGAWGFVTLVKNFLLGYIVSIYLLFSKETLIAQVRKIIFATFRKPTAEGMLRLGAQTNSVFSGFLTGKIIDSLIIGLLCFIGLTVIGMPYNVLISVIVGVTNIIPFFGPFIGAIPSGILILLVEPKKVIWLLLFILILQQFDGNILGPKILGNSTGLPAIWVMVSLLIGGGLFGFVGMLLSVPAFALIYSLTRDSVEVRLKKKKMPVSTQYYIENSHKLYGTKPVKKTPLSAEELEKIVIPSADEVNEAVETAADSDEEESEDPPSFDDSENSDNKE